MLPNSVLYWKKNQSFLHQRDPLSSIAPSALFASRFSTGVENCSVLQSDSQIVIDAKLHAMVEKPRFTEQPLPNDILPLDGVYWSEGLVGVYIPRSRG